MSQEQAQNQEIAALRRSAAVVITWLLLFTIVSLSLTVLFLAKETILGITDLSTQRIMLCVVGGTLGSAMSALVSAVERLSNGWELSGGCKLPAPEPKDKFVARMVPSFLIRPFLGSAIGLFVYAGVTSGYLIAVENPQEATFSRQALLFFAFLAGLFAKTLIEKLRAMFDAFFGR